MPRIVVIGSSNTDLIMKIPRFPKPGETILGGTFSIAQGGKGANQAVAAARAGASVDFISCVGNDLFGKNALDAYMREKISMHHSTVSDQHATGVAMILVDASGENSISVASGANMTIEAKQITNALPVLENSDLVLVQLEIPVETVELALRQARQRGKTTLLNPAPAQPLSDELLRCVSIITPNETEAELLTGIHLRDDESIRKAATLLYGRGIETVIVTLGKRGVFFTTTHDSDFIPGFSVTAVDTTAAGDIFSGALATALAEHRPLREAIRFANAAAALSVTKLGAQPSAPYRREIDAFLNSH